MWLEHREHTSATCHSRFTAGSLRTSRTVSPAHTTLDPSCHAHSPAWHRQAASGRGVASRAWAAACAAAKDRAAAVSGKRGGIRHGAPGASSGRAQVTVAVRSAWPSTRTVQQRPGTRDAGETSL
jgi:hypothetical protein